MNDTHTRVLASRFAVLLLLCGFALAIDGCKSAEASAAKTVEEYLTSRGVPGVEIDAFYTDPNFPDKAYVSATATHNFLSSEGKPQKELLGFILKRAGQGWQVEKMTAYTKEKNRASTLLSGQK